MKEESDNKSGGLERVGERTVIIQDESLRKLKGFIQIPRVILMHPKLSYGAKVTYGVLLGYAWQDDFCYPAQEAIANDLTCSSRQVRRFLEELRIKEFISWKQQGLNRPNIYSILAIQQEKTFKNKDRTNMSTPERTNMSAQERTPTSYKVEPLNIYKKTLNVKNDNEEISNPNKANKNPYEPKTTLRKLTDLPQAKEETQYIADEIYRELRDKQSKGFYYLVASKVPEGVIRQILGEIKLGGARSPERVFTSRIKTYAADRIAMRTKQNLYADIAALTKQKAIR